MLFIYIAKCMLGVLLCTTSCNWYISNFYRRFYETARFGFVNVVHVCAHYRTKITKFCSFLHMCTAMFAKSFSGPPDNMSDDFEQIIRRFDKNQEIFQFKYSGKSFEILRQYV